MRISTSINPKTPIAASCTVQVLSVSFSVKPLILQTTH